MKNLILIIGLLVLANQVSAATVAPAHRLLEQALRDDEVVGSAIKRATELGESCNITVESIKHDSAGAENFKARVDCSVEGNGEVGGGVILMMEVEGRAFDSFIEHYVIHIDKAG